jgi:hypothetical protein
MVTIEDDKCRLKYEIGEYKKGCSTCKTVKNNFMQLKE